VKTFILFVLAMLVGVSGSWGQVGTQPSAGRDMRVENALRAYGLDVRLDGPLYRLIFEMENGRSQLVMVGAPTEKYRMMEIREIYSICGRMKKGGELPVALANKLLKDNYDKKVGCWALVGDTLVYMVRVDASADKGVLAAVILAVAEAADAQEKLLTGDKDEF
jgi:hypothetical protein